MMVQFRLLACAALIGIGALGGAPFALAATMTEVARSEAQQWTGVAVTRDGRIFVNYPRWSETVPVSVAEIRASGEARPYPDTASNGWKPGEPPQDAFVCVQSVIVDGDGALWILDPANPRFAGVIEGGAKLIRVDPATDTVDRIYRFEPPVIRPDSYLNDVRVDTRTRHAFITDSGNGALVVVDLESGASRRLLEGHPSVQAEPVILTIDGRQWRKPDGTVPQVHADGLAITPDGAHLYYQALTGRTLYRISTAALLDASLPADALAGQVEKVGETGAADGIAFGADGRLYLTAIEHNAITRLTDQGTAETVIADERLEWPDSFAVGADGALYVTTSRIHLGVPPPGPFRLFRLQTGP